MLVTLLDTQVGAGDGLLLALGSAPLFLLIIKFLFIIGAVLYLIFSFVVIRQITLMRQTVITSLSGLLQLLGYAHFIFAAIVVLILFVIL